MGAFETSGPNAHPVAADDAFDTTESAILGGNLITGDNGAGVDSDADGNPLTVSAVDGNAAAVGTQITLASGALLTVQADGSFTYDPNDAFDSLAAGATATDSFEYTLADGEGGTDTGLVEITIQGLDDRADVRALVRRGQVILSVSGQNANLAADLDIVFDADGVTITGLNGTTINGEAMLQADDVEFINARLGNGSDILHVSGEADRLTLQLGNGENEVYFDGFASARATTVTSVGADSALHFSAIDSQFQSLSVRGSQGDDVVVLDGVEAERGAIFALFGGENSVEVMNSQIDRVFTVNSSGPPEAALNFYAADSEFERLNILGSRLGDDVVELDAVTVSGAASVNLYQGLGELSVRDSLFENRVRLSSTGDGTMIDTESDSNGIGTTFEGAVAVVLGGDADLRVSPTGSDLTAFESQVSISAREPDAELEAENVQFNRNPRLRNVVWI
jgi:VCBS repeat-containing protein